MADSPLVAGSARQSGGPMTGSGLSGGSASRWRESGRVGERCGRHGWPPTGWRCPMTPSQNRGSNTVVMRWSGHPRCVGMAREELRKALAGWGLLQLEEDAVLVLSELLTNAVAHACKSGAGVETCFVPLPYRLRVEVRDASSKLPEQREPEPGELSGRGLGLVEELSDQWGWWLWCGRGKTVWAELSLRPGSEGGLLHEC
ncbi:ATP-binding protein [Streptomyces sp. NPDC055037]